MTDYLLDYAPILLFGAIAVALGLVFLAIPALFAPSNPDPEKVAAYECGFDAFDSARGKFDVQFYLVAILFIIFDLEIALLVPWALVLGGVEDMSTRVFTFISASIFVGVLTLGLLYEWRKGALEWR